MFRLLAVYLVSLLFISDLRAEDCPRVIRLLADDIVEVPIQTPAPTEIVVSPTGRQVVVSPRRAPIDFEAINLSETALYDELGKPKSEAELGENNVLLGFQSFVRARFSPEGGWLRLVDRSQTHISNISSELILPEPDEDPVSYGVFTNEEGSPEADRGVLSWDALFRTQGFQAWADSERSVVTATSRGVNEAAMIHVRDQGGIVLEERSPSIGLVRHISWGPRSEIAWATFRPSTRGMKFSIQPVVWSSAIESAQTYSALESEGAGQLSGIQVNDTDLVVYGALHDSKRASFAVWNRSHPHITPVVQGLDGLEDVRWAGSSLNEMYFVGRAMQSRAGKLEYPFVDLVGSREQLEVAKGMQAFGLHSSPHLATYISEIFLIKSGAISPITFPQRIFYGASLRLRANGNLVVASWSEQKPGVIEIYERLGEEIRHLASVETGLKEFFRGASREDPRFRMRLHLDSDFKRITIFPELRVDPSDDESYDPDAHRLWIVDLPEAL
jgi:hypothetical protein